VPRLGATIARLSMSACRRSRGALQQQESGENSRQPKHNKDAADCAARDGCAISHLDETEGCGETDADGRKDKDYSRQDKTNRQSVAGHEACAPRCSWRVPCVAPRVGSAGSERMLEPELHSRVKSRNVFSRVRLNFIADEKENR
jgi:hypothetical protein